MILNDILWVMVGSKSKSKHVQTVSVAAGPLSLDPLVTCSEVWDLNFARNFDMDEKGMLGNMMKHA